MAKVFQRRDPGALSQAGPPQLPTFLQQNILQPEIRLGRRWQSRLASLWLLRKRC
jgi:hypothetical protein